MDSRSSILCQGHNYVVYVVYVVPVKDRHFLFIYFYWYLLINFRLAYRKSLLGDNGDVLSWLFTKICFVILTKTYLLFVLNCMYYLHWLLKLAHSHWPSSSLVTNSLVSNKTIVHVARLCFNHLLYMIFNTLQFVDMTLMTSRHC